MWHFLCSSKYTYPENGFQKFNEIQRRRLRHWNRHIDSLIFVARPHHCHQSLAMINNACYQLFTAKLNCLMDTFWSSSGGQSTEATRSAANWLLELGAHLPGETVGVFQIVSSVAPHCLSDPSTLWLILESSSRDGLGESGGPSGGRSSDLPLPQKPIYFFYAWTMLL